MKFFIFALLVSLTPSAWSQVLPAAFTAAEGKTFNVLGPNCFATALKLNGLTRSYRAMGSEEFKEIANLFCKRVANPEIGDIGVFEKPDFGFIHAYAYISKDLGMQKPGVDYNGKTPIRFYSTDSIQFMYLAPMECRRDMKDISTCANEHYYLHCEPVNMMGSLFAEDHDQVIRDIEVQLDFLLESSSYSNREKEVFLGVQTLVASARQSLENESQIPAPLMAFLKARIKSLENQLKFMEVKF